MGEADGRQLAEEAPGDDDDDGGGGGGDRPPERDAGEAGTRPARGRCHLPGGTWVNFLFIYFYYYFFAAPAAPGSREDEPGS